MTVDIDSARIKTSKCEFRDKKSKRKWLFSLYTRIFFTFCVALQKIPKYWIQHNSQTNAKIHYEKQWYCVPLFHYTNVVAMIILYIIVSRCHLYCCLSLQTGLYCCGRIVLSVWHRCDVDHGIDFLISRFIWCCH